MDTGVLQVVKAVLGIGLAIELILGGRKIVIFVRLVILIAMVMVVIVGRVDVVSSKVNIVISSDFEENILRVRDGKGEWLLVVL